MKTLLKAAGAAVVAIMSLATLASFNPASAMPIAPVVDTPSQNLVQDVGWRCGPGWHIGPAGCVPNRVYRPYVRPYARVYRPYARPYRPVYRRYY